MNELNYASLSASKKLVDNWIVLETDFVWRKKRDKTGYYLSRKALYHRTSDVPAPSMAEMWMELPDIYQGKLIYLTKVGNQTQVGYGWPYMPSSSIVGQNINPTDALIDLLVWLKGAGK